MKYGVSPPQAQTNRPHRLAMNAMSSISPRSLLMARDAKITDQQVFNVRIPNEGGPITNQQQSGQCWLFASTNVFRVALMQKYGVDSFELSQAYLFFWDKLEKANFFLENSMDLVEEPLNSRLLQYLTKSAENGARWAPLWC